MTTVPLRSLCELIVDCPHSTPKWLTDGGVLVFRSHNIRGGRLNLSDCSFTSEDEYRARTRRATPQAGDIIITREAPMGEAAMVPRGLRGCLGQRMVLLRPKPSEVDGRYLLFALLSPAVQDEIRSHDGTGSTVSNLRIPALERLAIPVVALKEQRAIAQVLGAVDDKIDLNRRMNHALEAMARAHFKSWFVDFDPVRAKAEGRQPWGIDPESAGLFPATLAPSQSGYFPSGWAVGTLGQIAEVIDCLHAKKPDRQDDGRTYLQLNNIRNDGLLDLSDTYCISQTDYANWTTRMEAREGDCVITNVGRVGVAAQVPRGVYAALGRNMTGIRPRPSYPFPTFLILTMTSASMRREISDKTDTGTILDALNVRAIPNLRLSLPPLPVLRAFENLARPLRQRMEHNLAESRTLEAGRDLLLPKLLSGKLRVMDAEAVLAATA